MAADVPKQSWWKRLTATFIGSALVTATRHWKWVLARQILARVVGGVIAWVLIVGVFDNYFFSSCLEGVEFIYEKSISDSMRYNWSSSPLDWLKVKAVNRCDEPISFDATCQVVSALEGDRDVGIPCHPQPTPPHTFHVPADETLIAEFDPPLNFDISNWLQNDNVVLSLNFKVVDKSDRRVAGSALGVLFRTTTEERVETYPVNVQLLPRTNYLWRMDENPRDAVLASLAVWTVRPRDHAARLAEQLSLQDSLDDWMERTYERVFAEVEVQPRHDQLPPSNEDIVIIDPPENVLANGAGSPIETALLFAALASHVIGSQSRNDRIILMMAPDNENPQAPGTILVAWASGERPRDLRAFPASNAGLDFDAATVEADSYLRRLPLDLILDELDDDGVYVGIEERMFALDVRKAASHYRLSGGLP